MGKRSVAMAGDTAAVQGSSGKVRWDAVVDCRPAAQALEPVIPRQPAAAAQCGGDSVAVKVWLYGTLADEKLPRPLELQLAAAATVASIIPELGLRLGEDFLAKVLDRDGRKFNQCLVFVDGVKLDALDVPLRRDRAAVEMEMILLTVTEGG